MSQPEDFEDQPIDENVGDGQFVDQPSDEYEGEDA